MQPLFSQRNQLLILDWANVVSRAFSVSGEREDQFLSRLLSMLYKYRESFPNFEFVFALEGKGKQERRKLLPKYKLGARKSLDIPTSYYRKSLELLTFIAGKRLKAPLGEADDAIASFLTQRVDPSDSVGIVTEDKDLWQLVQDPFRWVESTKRGKVTEGVVTQVLKGIKPREILLYKVLCGDPSDNIPKVPFLRNKTALKLVKEGPTLKELLQVIKNIENFSWITKKEKDNLKLCKKQIKLNYKLVKLCSNLAFHIKTIKPKPNKLNKFLVNSSVFSFSKKELVLLTGK